MDTLAPSASELREAFAKFDADGNGFLTPDELVGIFTRPGGGNPMTEAQARAFIQEHDRNGDGRLDLDEFTVSMVGLEGFTLTGVTLAVLRRLRASAVEKRAAAGPPSDMRTALNADGELLRAPRNAGEVLTTADVCFEVVKPATAARQCSFAELDAAPGESGPATAFVSHAWLYPFEWVVSALEAANLPADTLFWFDVAVVNQHTNATRGFDWWSSTFRQAVKTIGRTVLVLAPWRAPVPLQRAWCIWEIFCTVDTDTELHVLLPAAERDAFATALVDDFDSIVKVVCAVDVEKAEAHSDTDRDNIFAAVRETCGFHKLNVAAAGGLRGALALAGAQVLVERNAAGDEALGLAFGLAELYQQQGRYDEAKAMYERVLASDERTLGPDHPSTLASVVCLANVLDQQGKRDEAKAMHERALAGHERTHGVDHPSTLLTVGNLAGLLYEQGKLDEAKAMNERALAGKERALGADHPSTLLTVNNLANVLMKQRKYDEANAMYERALAGEERALGADHPNTLDTVLNLAGVLVDQGKLDEAKAMHERALAGYERALGADHRKTLRTINNLAEVLRHQGKLDEAKAMNERALAGKERALGADHPDTLMTVGNLALVLWKQGRLDEAKAMNERVLAGREQAFGADHPDTLGTVGNLAAVLMDQGKLDEAKAMFQRALAGFERALGADHPSTLMTVEVLATF